MGIRKPVVMGTFYEEDFQDLEEQIKLCFMHDKGPGDLPTRRTDKKIKGVILPHAGYGFSGACAAWGFKEIAESALPDVYAIIGPNHTGSGKSSIILDGWQTPFGVVKADVQLGRALVKNSDLVEDAEAHLHEHSIEVQLPFLQFVNKDVLQQIRILPIAISEGIDLNKLALDIKETIMDFNKSVVFIVSSDFTHFGPQFRYVPFSLDIPQKIAELDQDAIKFIKNMDADGFLKYVYETGATICGRLPIALLLKTLEKTEGKLLQYYTSGELMNNYRNSVSYAAILFE